MLLGRLVIAASFIVTLSACDTTGSIDRSHAPLGFGSNQARALSTHMPVGEQVMPPLGYIAFCIRNADECRGGTNNPETVELTPALWTQINEINDHVNSMPQVDDFELYQQAEYWTYPTAEYGGDCEDLALEKRRLLMEQGWPESALLMAVAREWNGNGHAVLIVVTDKGDYVLDNKSWQIRRWQDAPYTWVKRQSRERPFIWVNLDRKNFRMEANAALPPLGSEASFLRYARLATDKAKDKAKADASETAALRPSIGDVVEPGPKAKLGQDVAALR